jgi:hypothetical protein
VPAQQAGSTTTSRRAHCYPDPAVHLATSADLITVSHRHEHHR